MLDAISDCFDKLWVVFFKVRAGSGAGHRDDQIVLKIDSQRARRGGAVADGAVAESVAFKPGKSDSPSYFSIRPQEFVEFLWNHFLERFLTEKTLIAVGAMIGQHLAESPMVNAIVKLGAKPLRRYRIYEMGL